MNYEKGPEGASYKAALTRISELADEINGIIDSLDELPSWIQDKITISNHNMDATLGYFETQELDEESKGLWANIHAKRKRGERMRKPGEKGAPTQDALKRAQGK